MKSNTDCKIFPKHVSIIMDGNGRWARKRLLPRSAGHRAGANALKKLVEDLEHENLKYLSVYAFSTENWKRDKKEIDYLMDLLREYIKEYLDDVNKNNMKLKVIGDISKLDEDLQNDIKYLEDISKDKTGMTLIIGLNYGGRDEIIRAIKKLTNQIIKTNTNIDSIDENLFERYLDTFNIPSPDLLIRTSGEQRISNFLIWQTAYTELYFTDKLWPDFNISDFEKAVLHFKNRQRRFGGS